MKTSVNFGCLASLLAVFVADDSAQLTVFDK
jgi:hypothetical protein